MNTHDIVLLILKDLKVYRKYLLGSSAYGLVIILLVLLNEEKNMTGQYVNMSILLGVISTMHFMIEKENNTWMFMASLPVSRKSIFVARYLSSLIILLFNLILSLLGFAFLEHILEIDLHVVFTTKVALMTLINAVFLWAIFYFVYYRYNVIVASICYMFSMFVAIVLVIKFWRTKDSFVPQFAEGELLTLGIPALVVFALFIVSFLFSLSHFRTKEL